MSASAFAYGAAPVPTYAFAVCAASGASTATFGTGDAIGACFAGGRGGHGGRCNCCP